MDSSAPILDLIVDEWWWLLYKLDKVLPNNTYVIDGIYAYTIYHIKIVSILKEMELFI